MDVTENGRPAKKARIDGPADDSSTQSKAQQTEYKRQQRRADLDHPQPESAEHRRDRELFGIDEDNEEEIGLEPLQDEERKKLKKMHVPKMFSQPSVMASGDKGIFVTCDIGREKKSLIELADLVEDYMEKHEMIPAELLDPSAMLNARVERQSEQTATVAVDNEPSPEEDTERDIESSINAELLEMQSPGHQGDPGTSSIKVKAFQLITLDVPCVSFLRFTPTSPMFDKVDVVDIVHSICADAAKSPGQMRSRYIRRLCPIVWLGKVLSNGLERACEEVLPRSFKISGTGAGVKFAIKTNIRNNSKVSRGDMIKQIAEEVQKYGEDKHKVDLTGYERGVLVEVYRGWVGMSVVDNTSTSELPNAEGEQNKVGYGFGYEALKKFNLAEIYAGGHTEGDAKGSTLAQETDGKDA